MSNRSPYLLRHNLDELIRYSKMLWLATFMQGINIDNGERPCTRGISTQHDRYELPGDKSLTLRSSGHCVPLCDPSRLGWVPTQCDIVLMHSHINKIEYSSCLLLHLICFVSKDISINVFNKSYFSYVDRLEYGRDRGGTD